MSDLIKQFEQAASEVQQLTRRPDNDTLLRLYALYKQATTGDARGKRPGMFDMVGQAKFDAWSKLAGTPQAAAMQQYIDLVKKLTSS